MLKYSMRQLEIDFFWPLTEQIRLDLDYTPCEKYQQELRAKELTSSVLSGAYLISNGGVGDWGAISAVPQSLSTMTEFRPTPESVGYWLVSPELKYYVTKEPKWIVKKMTKYLLGWEWGEN